MAPLHAIGCEFVGPGEDEGYRKPSDDEEREDPHDPLGGLEGRQKDGRNLNQQPSDNGVGHCDLDDVASFQLTPDRGHMSPLDRVSFSGPILPSSGPQITQNQVKSPLIWLVRVAERLLFSPKQTFARGDLDSVRMAAFGHKQTFKFYAYACILTVNERLLSAKSGHKLDPRSEHSERPLSGKRTFEITLAAVPGG